jgi:hypothetical protein
MSGMKKSRFAALLLIIVLGLSGCVTSGPNGSWSWKAS